MWFYHQKERFLVFQNSNSFFIIQKFPVKQSKFKILFIFFKRKSLYSRKRVLLVGDKFLTKKLVYGNLKIDTCLYDNIRSGYGK